ncbi:MAG: inositol monophosphatase family protein [Candidatus Competibacterales bacterium]|nr:inositol monophosphatase family protein [Candidatus Competibacterales bacterium]
MSTSEHLEVALRAARAAEAVIRHYYQRNLRIRLKADRTPVTVADVEAERAIKQELAAAFPDHGFHGEEGGRENSDAEHVWLIDPIDGTKSFVRQSPFFSTQIALRRRGEFVLGVSNAPLFGELAWAERGRGAWLNDTRLAVSGIDDLAEATVSFGNIKSLVRDNGAGFARLVAGCNRLRGYGDFCHGHLLASGRIDVVVESEVSILDVAALGVIIEEAGGRVGDLAGRPLDLDSTSFLASNGHLHETVRALLG